METARERWCLVESRPATCHVFEQSFKCRQLPPKVSCESAHTLVRLAAVGRFGRTLLPSPARVLLKKAPAFYVTRVHGYCPTLFVSRSNNHYLIMLEIETFLRLRPRCPLASKVVLVQAFDFWPHFLQLTSFYVVVVVSNQWHFFLDDTQEASVIFFFSCHKSNSGK